MKLMTIKIGYSVLIISLFLLTSCSDKRDFERYLNHTGVELKDKYSIDSIKQVGFTDCTLESYVKISNRDKAIIVNELKKKIKFQKVRTENEYYDSIYQKGDSLHGFIIERKYYFGIYETRFAKTNKKIEPVGYKMYDLVLDTTTNKLYFKYEYE